MILKFIFTFFRKREHVFLTLSSWHVTLTTELVKTFFEAFNLQQSISERNKHLLDTGRSASVEGSHFMIVMTLEKGVTNLPKYLKGLNIEGIKLALAQLLGHK